MFTTIVLVLVALSSLINNYRINILRIKNRELTSSIQSVRDQRKSDYNKAKEEIELLGGVFRAYLGIYNINLGYDKSHAIIETKDGFMFMDLCKMNKQFVPLLKVGKTIPSENERLHYRGQEYHYTPVKEVACTDF